MDSSVSCPFIARQHVIGTSIEKQRILFTCSHEVLKGVHNLRSSQSHEVLKGEHILRP